MSRPDFAFQTTTHTVYPTSEAGVYRAEPGGARLDFSLDAQRVPAELESEEMERAVQGWVMARGGRRLNLNGRARDITPEGLDRPPAGAVRRLVSIAPSNAEIVGALGATELLVGVESSSDFPPEVSTLPRLGPDLHVDMAALAALRPDLVLASLTVPGMERNLAALERLGVPYLVLAPRSLDEIMKEIGRVGRALGRMAEAEHLTASMAARREGLRAAAEGRAPVRVFLEWWPKPMFTPGRTCWSNELIALAGGVNVFGGLAGQSGEVTAEQVAAADPEVIFVSWCGVPNDKLNPDRVLRREGLEGVSAVRHRRVHTLEESLIGRPGPRVMEAIERMAERLHPAPLGQAAEG